MQQVKDPLGTFYAFTMPKSIIKRTVPKKKRSQGAQAGGTCHRYYLTHTK